MKINVRTNISKDFKEIELCINAPERNDQVIGLENELINIGNKKLNEIVGMQGNDIFLIKVPNIIKIYSEEKSNFCETNEGVFKIKEKMYYLQEILSSKDFIRISNSVIVNINHVKCFNTSIIGKIIVILRNGSEESVSKRRTSEIMKFLKDRSDVI